MLMNIVNNERLVDANVLECNLCIEYIQVNRANECCSNEFMNYEVSVIEIVHRRYEVILNKTSIHSN